MSRKEAITVHKRLHELSVEHLDLLKSRGCQGDELQGEMTIIAMVLADKLHEATGVNSDDLDAATERLNLEEDAEYQIMVREYTQVVQKIKLGQ